ncbi:PaaI family thioesterase [Gordonia McavH-238-E]|uniref:PaaI family thioesterase n=1 Tax=Gordonia sp. McavH-238-E TaxID=2917736 RepID=UPI001EF50ADD|nr:PaaI family thioesterase [Gordonia sp. McavH-238-E]MCG7632813.1 PaaI family thioesterase [Gordonia sp. McavH-238-E]
MSNFPEQVDPAFVAPSTEDWNTWLSWATNVPASLAMGLVCVSTGLSRTVMTMAESAWPLNPNGSVHGGLVAAAADQVGGVAAVAACGEGAFPATATLTAHYLRPALPGLTFEGKLIRRGKRILFIDIDVTDRHGALCTKFSGTWSVNGGTPK